MKPTLPSTEYEPVNELISRRTISPFRDDYPESYASGLAESADGALWSVRRYLSRWRYVAPEAFDIAHRMTPHGFRAFVHELRREKRGNPSRKPLHDDFLELRMPTTMLVVSMAASRLQLPWGAAFHRLLARSGIIEREGVVRPERGILRSILEGAPSLRALPLEAAAESQ